MSISVSSSNSYGKTSIYTMNAVIFSTALLSCCYYYLLLLYFRARRRIIPAAAATATVANIQVHPTVSCSGPTGAGFLPLLNLPRIYSCTVARSFSTNTFLSGRWNNSSSTWGRGGICSPARDSVTASSNLAGWAVARHTVRSDGSWHTGTRRLK